MATLFTSSSLIPKLSLRPKYTKRSKLPNSSKHSSINIINKDTTGAKTPPAAQPLTKPPSLPARIFDEIDKFINTHIDPPRKPCYDPRHVLSDNFAPVDELPPTECEVVAGSLPPTLRGGAYVRNGPNPHIFPRGPHHLFDGDGMLHSVKISDDGEGAIFCSRYVQTNKYKTEHEMGMPIFPKVFSDFNSLPGMVARGALIAARLLAGQINIGKGTGLANTGLSLIAGQLYALGDSDLPYSIKIGADGEIHTLGRRDFDGKLRISMAGHNKTDTETGEAFACSCRPFNYPFLTFFRIGANGEKSPDVPIFSMKAPTLVHDLAITKKYAIFNEMQIGWNPTAVVTGNSMVGIDLKKVPRVGVIPRYAADEAEMQWFEVAGFNCIHLTNAWDEDDGDSIVLVAPNILAVEHTLERQDLIHVSIEKLKIDLRTGLVSRIPTCAWNLEFAVINPAFIGKKNKYVYATVGCPLPVPNVSRGVVKLNLSLSDGGDRRDCTVASRFFGAESFGSEPFFVAREPDNPHADEDDGYLLTYVHNFENSGETMLLVLDAKSPNLDIVTAVRLPGRVPWGLHGIFLREDDLDKLQKSS